MIWDSVNCCFHNFLMDPGFSRFKISFIDHEGLCPPSPSPLLCPPFLPHVGTVIPTRENGTGP